VIPSDSNAELLPDPLTGLPTRRGFLDRLQEALDHTLAGPGHVAVLFIDIDGFRRINRDLGHAVGDELLFSASRRIRSAARSGDILSRAGGDEFALMCCDLDSPDELAELGRRVSESFGDPFDLSGQVFSCSVSVGAAITDDASTRPESLIGDAEAALERAPAGRGRFELLDDELRGRFEERAKLGRELALALDAEEIELAYQPIVDIASGRIVSIEALARWNHHEQGPLSPELFVGLAQENGLGDELTRCLLGRAGTEFAAIAKEDPTDRVTLAFNVSADELVSDSLIAGIESLIARCGVGAHRIVIEISESALAGAVENYLSRVTELRALGVRISLDDFGTASTSIAQLRALPIDQMKLDRMFVDGLGEPSDDAALAAGVLPIARALGIEVVAEGIETDQQLAHLFALGYRLGQGYRFAIPVSPAEVAKLIRRGPLAAARTPETEAAAAARESFRRALVAGDASRAATVVEEAAHRGVGSMTIQTEVIGRALHWIDTEWEAGRLRAADEHLAAAICERELAAVLGSAPRRRRRFARRVLLAAIGGEAHRGELSRAAEALDSAGFETVYLGTDVRSEDIEIAAGMHRPGAVCLNTSELRGQAELQVAVDRLGAIPEPPIVIIGGGGVGDDAEPTSGAITIRSDQDAVEVLDHELAGRAQHRQLAPSGP
jgi:diguanylate cyclase (GGDEF)-like protein